MTPKTTRRKKPERCQPSSGDKRPSPPIASLKMKFPQQPQVYRCGPPEIGDVYQTGQGNYLLVVSIIKKECDPRGEYTRAGCIRFNPRGEVIQGDRIFIGYLSRKPKLGRLKGPMPEFDIEWF